MLTNVFLGRNSISRLSLKSLVIEMSQQWLLDRSSYSCLLLCICRSFHQLINCSVSTSLITLAAVLTLSTSSSEAPPPGSSALPITVPILCSVVTVVTDQLSNTTVHKCLMLLLSWCSLKRPQALHQRHSKETSLGFCEFLVASKVIGLAFFVQIRKDHFFDARSVLKVLMKVQIEHFCRTSWAHAKTRFLFCQT